MKPCDARSTSQLLKFFQTIKSTNIPTSKSYRSVVATDLNSPIDLFSKFIASKLTVYTDFNPMEDCFSEKLLLDLSVSQKQRQHICGTLDFEKTTGPDELPAIFLNETQNLSTKHLPIFFTEVNQQVSSLGVGGNLLLVQLSKNVWNCWWKSIQKSLSSVSNRRSLIAAFWPVQFSKAKLQWVPVWNWKTTFLGSSIKTFRRPNVQLLKLLRRNFCSAHRTRKNFR